MKVYVCNGTMGVLTVTVPGNRFLTECQHTINHYVKAPNHLISPSVETELNRAPLRCVNELRLDGHAIRHLLKHDSFSFRLFYIEAQSPSPHRSVISANFTTAPRLPVSYATCSLQLYCRPLERCWSIRFTHCFYYFYYITVHLHVMENPIGHAAH